MLGFARPSIGMHLEAAEGAPLFSGRNEPLLCNEEAFGGQEGGLAMPKQKRKRKNTALSQHKRTATTLTPPMMTLPDLRLVEWLPTQFPDMLWPCMLTSVQGRNGLRLAMRALELMHKAVTEGSDRLPIDGRLTTFEKLNDGQREAVLDALAETGLYERVFPEDFAQVLGMYPDAPGSWLIQPWKSRSLRVDPDQAESTLCKIILAARHGSTDTSTWAKAVAFGGLLIADKLRFSSDLETVDLLQRYPMLEDDENARVESFIRASFGAVINLDTNESENGEPEHQTWARCFWASNWRIYPCRSQEQESGDDLKADAIREIAAEFRGDVEAAHGRVLEIARTTDPGLYAPDRHEVLSGMAARGCRIAYAVSSSPIMWSGEHVASPARAILESQILLKWLALHPDPAIFVKFKEYGRGKLKLTKLHYEEHLDSMDNPPAGLAEIVEGLDRRVNEDANEEFQNINVGNAFGKDLRRMAHDVGMEDEYRLLYQPQSDISHGEWTSLDHYALQRCLNPAHRWHRLPREEIAARVDTQSLSLLATLLEELVTSYSEFMTPTDERTST